MNTIQHGAVTTLALDGISVGWEKWLCFMSDNHHDSTRCNRKLEERHFKLAKERDAAIFIFGDFFDAMQGRFDPRRDSPELRPEYYGKSNYYDLLVRDAADFLQPYAANIALIAPGNHELAVLKNANTMLTDRLCGMLNAMGGHVLHGSYGGWIIVDCTMRKTVKQRINIKYFHGAGGEAPVTRGVIQANRQSTYLPDAHIVINGHNHQGYMVAYTRERLTLKGNLYYDNCYYLRIPGYKNDYGDGSSGWEVTRGGQPKSNGCWWVHLTYQPTEERGGVLYQVQDGFEAPPVIHIPDGTLFNGMQFPDP